MEITSWTSIQDLRKTIRDLRETSNDPVFRKQCMHAEGYVIEKSRTSAENALDVYESATEELQEFSSKENARSGLLIATLKYNFLTGAAFLYGCFTESSSAYVMASGALAYIGILPLSIFMASAHQGRTLKSMMSVFRQLDYPPEKEN